MDRPLCSACDHIQLYWLVHYDSSKPLFEKIDLGSIFELRNKRAECVLCRVVLRLWDRYFESLLFDHHQTRILMKLSWPGMLSLSMDEEVFFETRLEDDSSTIDPAVRNQLITLVNGRQFQPAQVRTWLEKCNQTHSCLDTIRTLREATDQKSHIIYLIDVLAMKVSKATTKDTYLALSYVWGGTPTAQLTTQNLQSLSITGGLFPLFPNIAQVILDAIEVTKQLGHVYLWVDSLCIPQDDSCKHEQIAEMHHIYGRAVLTLAAVRGRDARTGLVDRLTSSQTQSSAETLLRDITLLQRLKGVRLGEFANFGHVPTFQTILKHSKFETRAWTFQERILSHRILYFTDLQVYFECKTGIKAAMVPDSEDTPALSSPATFGRRLQKDPQESMPYFPPLDVFKYYAEMVDGYSSRALTYESDVINAFSGIMENISSLTSSTKRHYYVCGTPLDWEHGLVQAMLWVPRERLRRRKTTFNGEDSTLPTWAWTGWVGKIGYFIEATGKHVQHVQLLHVLPGLAEGDTEAWIENRKSWLLSLDVLPRYGSHTQTELHRPMTIHVRAQIVPSSHFSFWHESSYDTRLQRPPTTRVNNKIGKACGIVFECASVINSKPGFVNSRWGFYIMMMSSFHFLNRPSDGIPDSFYMDFFGVMKAKVLQKDEEFDSVDLYPLSDLGRLVSFMLLGEVRDCNGVRIGVVERIAVGYMLEASFLAHGPCMQELLLI